MHRTVTLGLLIGTLVAASPDRPADADPAVPPTDYGDSSVDADHDGVRTPGTRRAPRRRHPPVPPIEGCIDQLGAF